ncbi:hypothetical protein RLT58_13410 [Streptomyces sp. ITFR-16]|nr:DUF6879 family protein [Streptomyces sp. ITFR-16]WNI22863.1 hypothetical protein RLT58_13410 [Streptomyces sp. ITFR-16]
MEMRDGYVLDDPRYLAWWNRQGVYLADRASWWGSRHDHVGEVAVPGVMARRDLIVSEPVTDYVRYEHDLTPTNLAAGEEARWLPRRWTTALALPVVDFRVFDDELVPFRHFVGGGGELAVKGREYVTGPSRAKPSCAREASEAVRRRAVPHAECDPV